MQIWYSDMVMLLADSALALPHCSDLRMAAEAQVMRERGISVMVIATMFKYRKSVFMEGPLSDLKCIHLLVLVVFFHLGRIFS